MKVYMTSGNKEAIVTRFIRRCHGQGYIAIYAVDLESLELHYLLASDWGKTWKLAPNQVKDRYQVWVSKGMIGGYLIGSFESLEYLRKFFDCSGRPQNYDYIDTVANSFVSWTKIWRESSNVV